MKYYKKSDNIHNHIFTPNTVGKWGLFRLVFRKEYDGIRVFSCSDKNAPPNSNPSFETFLHDASITCHNKL